MGYLLSVLSCFVLAVILTPLIKKLAIAIGAVDKPDNRKVHTKLMPRMGGLAIYLSFLVGLLVFHPEGLTNWGIMSGATLIVIIGIIDDKYQLSAKIKFAGQIIAAGLTVLDGVQIDFIVTPFGDRIEFGIFAIPITILWIVGITNAINLIDGLDGLAAGVSAIALLTISILAITMGNVMVGMIGLILVGSILGFLVFNFYPAKIFMGDTGSLFLGYMISVLAIMGLFKNVTLFSLALPIVILAVPILDTLFAIIRRIVQRKPISAPDKFHLHHCLINLGFSHRQSVILIYALSSLFSLAAVVFTKTTMWGASLLFVLLLIMIELLVEITGLISYKYRPILSLVEVYKSKKK